MLLLFLGVFAAAFFARLAFVLLRPLPTRAGANGCTTLAVLGSGGHTTEMLSLLCALLTGLRSTQGTQTHSDTALFYDPRTYLVAASDTMSVRKIADFEANIPGEYQVKYIPRSREVGQSYGSAVFSVLRAQAACVPLLLAAQPDLVLCNGPGTCLPVCCAAFFMRVIGLKPARIVYVESFARVKSLSLTGRLLYQTRIADDVIVQWEELARRYPRAIFLGLLV